MFHKYLCIFCEQKKINVISGKSSLDCQVENESTVIASQTRQPIPRHHKYVNRIKIV